MFALAGGAILLIAFLTVVFLAARAARANPVRALRYE
jgi:ABC-type antimicrobial peptide transport system permease subunit